MGLKGYPSVINEQYKLIEDIIRYYATLASNPHLIKTGEADNLVNSIKDEGLRKVIIHIGKYGHLPDHDFKRLVNGEHARDYARVSEIGWSNLEHLMRKVKIEFMPDVDPSQIMYSRQVALYCKGCNEYKASGMFTAPKKDKSYDAQIDFQEEHIIDPNRTRMVGVKPRGKSKKKKVIQCVTCNSANKKQFERRYGGRYASARAYAYNPHYLDRLREEEESLPTVLAVRIRLKEPISAAKKLAFQYLDDDDDRSRHIEILEEKRAELEEIVGEEGFSALVAETKKTIFDIFGLRLITSTYAECYKLMQWFEHFGELSRFADYIERPKPNEYQSLHASFTSPSLDQFAGIHIPIELQIRTEHMNWVAEEGPAARGPDKGRREIIGQKGSLALQALTRHLTGH